jgi:putative transposase
MPYIRLHAGFVYLVAVMDWFSRYVLSWAVSITMDVSFCLEALEQALGMATPDIFNSDQGSQFTSADLSKRRRALEGIKGQWGADPPIRLDLPGTKPLQ